MAEPHKLLFFLESESATKFSIIQCIDTVFDAFMFIVDCKAL